MIDIKIILLSDIPETLLCQAAKEHVTIAKDKTQIIWGAYTEGMLIGFSSLVLFKHNRYGLLKSAYVVQEYRRKGVYRALNMARLEYAKSLGLPHVLTSAYFEAAEHLLKIGGIIEKQYNEGYKIKITL